GVVWVVDTELRYLVVEGGLLERLGMVREQMEQRPVREALDEQARDFMEERFRRSLAGEQSALEWVDRGHVIWTQFVPLRDQTGRIEAAMGVGLDITERKLTEEALKESEERFRTILDSVVDGILVADIETKKFYTGNKAICQMLGYSLEEIKNLGVPDIHPEKDLPYVLKQFEKQSREGSSLARHIPLKRRDGSVFYTDVNSSLLTFRRKTYLVGVFRDITEEEKLEERLIRTEKMESLGRLAGGIAHDFNNILSSILGYAELVMDDVPKGTLTHENLEQVLLAGKRGKEIVKQILAFSRQEKQERVPVQVRRVVEETAKLLRASIPSSIEMRLDAQTDAMVMANASQISQIIMNLYTNSVQALGDEKGFLEVSLKEEELDEEFVQTHPGIEPGRYVRLTVSDTGHGIDPAIMGRIFDPFFTTKEKGNGTGMGLTVVLGIVKSLGGEITVYSKPGKGTTVNVFLPVSERLAHGEETDTAPVRGGTERILFVDDEAQIVGMGKQILGRMGYHVVAQTSPLDALEAFRAQPDRFDLVITDVTMPEMTGDRLAGELKRIRPDIPIILCTGFSERITEENTKSLGVEEYLMKPLLKKDVAEAVRRALDRARLRS
ncbi:MAG: PAS domain S-box protein, partial [Acidobacteriota bacterium]